MANRRRYQYDLRAGSKLIRRFQIFFREHLHEILMLVRQMPGVNAAQMVLLILLEPWDILVVMRIEGVKTKNPDPRREPGPGCFVSMIMN